MNSVPQTHLGIGIDTARYGHHVSFMDEHKRTAAKGFHFTENADGYRLLATAIEHLCRKHPDCVLQIHVDAAGQYADNLLQWLHQQDWPAIVSVGQPARNKNYRKAHYDKRKADPIESLACARFGVIERPPAMLRPAAEFSTLRDAVAQMEASATARTRLINQLHNLLARAFPEFAVLVTDIASQSMLNLLAKYPTAQRIAAARLASISKLPHVSDELASQLHQAAQQSTAANRNPTTELLIKQKVESIRSEIKIHKELEKIVQNAVKELPKGGHNRLRSIPGIGPQTEAALIAKIVTIKRFARPEALIGYFGIFPEEVNVSGVNKDGTPKTGTEIRMSRKGNDLVRRLLYTAAQVAVKHNPPVGALFARLRAQGKEYNVAIGRCMAKLLRQVFAVWQKDCEFDPNWETPAQPNAADRAHEGATLTENVAAENVAGHSQEQSPIRKVVTATKPMIARQRPALNFAELRARISVGEILRLLNWSPSSGSNPSRGPCPVHRSTTTNSTSFAVNITKNVYCCHRCGSQGNALDLWAAAQNMPLFEAAWDLVDRLAIEPPLLEKKENCHV